MIGLYNPSKNNNAAYKWLDGTAYDYQNFGPVSGTYGNIFRKAKGNKNPFILFSVEAQDYA